MRSLAEVLAGLSEEERREVLAGLSDGQAEALRWDWRFWARPEQLAPEGDWLAWLYLAGRGSGKTRSGAEFIREEVESGRAKYIGLIAPTAADARDVMVLGESGILAISPPHNRPSFEPSNRRLTWPNGARATLFSAEEPDRLRGPQHDLLWCDELAAWADPRATWDMAMFGLRLGAKPRAMITTTPRPIPIIKEMVARRDFVVTRGSTTANVANLAPSFFQQVISRYEGTRLGRQELDGEIVDEIEGALWTRAILEKQRLEPNHNLPELRRIVVAVDPSGKREAGDKRDDIGIAVVGRGDDHKAYVLADWTCNLSPAGWASRVMQAYVRYQADLIVAEANFGGAMVESIIQTVDENAPVKMVTASRGKVVRAEPVAALYEQGKVFHVGAQKKLEDELCNFTPLGYIGEGSPNRADALVWALTELMIESPDEEANGAFKRNWFKLWPNGKPLPDFQHIVVAMRTSFDDEHGKGKGAGPVSMGIYGVFNIPQCFDERERKRLQLPAGQKYAALLCDFWSEQISYSETLERAREAVRQKYGKKPGGRPSMVIVEEGGSDQFSIRKALYDFNVPNMPFMSEHSRTMRAHQAAPLVEQGGLFVPESSIEDRKGKPRDWVEPLIKAACRFSGEGSIPEQGVVDQLTAALLYLQNRDVLKADPRRVAYPDPDEAKDTDEREAEEIYRRQNKRSFYGS